jgi:hypothetical protein
MVAPAAFDVDKAAACDTLVTIPRSVVMQSSDVHRRAVNKKSAYSAAPTLRSNATTSGLFSIRAKARGVAPLLQAGA